jgi:hypothetical protein
MSSSFDSTSRKLQRSALRRAVQAVMGQFIGNAVAARPATSAGRSGRARHGVDPLEQRQLLVAIPSGYYMELQTYRSSVSLQDSSLFLGTGVRVLLEDPSADALPESQRPSVEVIGATIDRNGNARLNDIPATAFSIDQLNSQPRSRVRATNLFLNGRNLGGLAGQVGLEPVARAPDADPTDDVGGVPLRMVTTDDVGYTDPDFPFPFPIDRPAQSLPTSRLNVIRYAATSKVVYGIDAGTQPVGNDTLSFYRILAFNFADGSATVVDYIQEKILDAVQPDLTTDTPERRKFADIKSINGFDYDAASGNFYFVATVSQSRPTPNGDLANVDVPLLFEYGRGGTVRVVSDFQSSSTVTTSTVDDFTVVNGRVYWFGTAKQIEGTGDDTTIVTYTGLYQADLAEENGVSVLGGFEPNVPSNLVYRGDTISSLQAIEYDSEADTFYIMLEEGDRQLLRAVNASSIGIGDTVPLEAFGGLRADPGDSYNNRILGDQIPDIAFVPQGRNPFDGGRGVLVTGDRSADVLLYVDTRERFPESGLFSIYVKNSTPTTKLIVTAMDYIPLATSSDGNDDFVIGGDAQPFDFTPLSPDRANPPHNGINEDDFADDTGALYLGLRERSLNGQGFFDEYSSPVTAIDRTTYAGSPPDILIDQGLSTVQAGIFVLPRELTRNKGQVYAKQATGLDTLFFGGTITGSVYVDGRLNNFYAGNVLTGDARGEGASDARNFTVTGDMRSFVVKGDVGTLASNADYSTGFDLYVNGKGVEYTTLGNFRGGVQLTGRTRHNTDKAPNTYAASEESFDEAIVERETRGDAGDAFMQGFLADSSFYNDTPQTREFIGSYFSQRRGKGGQAQVVGSIDILNGDSVDWYGVPLLAGQTIDLSTTGGGTAAIYDPERRLYYSGVSAGQQFTADKPGTWLIQVTGVGAYSMTINRMADVTLGGFVVGAEYRATQNNAASFLVDRGDMGQFQIGGEFILDSLADDITIRSGNLRGAAAATFGDETVDEDNNVLGVGDTPSLRVPGGSVGRLSSTGNMYLNFRQVDSDNEPILAYGVGVDYQLVDAGGDFSGVLIANRGIGVIRGNTIGSSLASFPGYYRNDADGTGDGFIDLIYSGNIVEGTRTGGTIGNPTSGGPAIANGPGGNVRYMMAHGAVYRDQFFGAGPEPTIEAKQSVLDLIDDSGAKVRIAPLATPLLSTLSGTETNGNGTVSNDPFSGFVPRDPFGGSVAPPTNSNGDPVQTEAPSGRIVASTYGVRTGGSIIFEVSSTRGIAINTEGQSKNSRAEIGRLNAFGPGAALEFTPTTGTTAGNPFGAGGTTGAFTFADGSRNLSVQIRGARTDVFEINGRDGVVTGSGLDNQGGFYSINNDTSGEIVNVHAESVAYLDAQRLGSSKSSSGTTVEGNVVATDGTIDPQIIISESVALTSDADPATETSEFFPIDTQSVDDRENVDNIPTRVEIGYDYPFNRTKNMVLMGNSIRVRARDVLGNVAILGAVDTVTANSDGKNTKGLFEGIGAPLYVQNSVRQISIGEGVAWSGSGLTSFGGIYVGGNVSSIVNTGEGSDIRGDVLFGNALNQIKLSDGAIIDSLIYNVGASITSANGIVTVENVFFSAGVDFIPRVPTGSNLVDPIDDTKVDQFNNPPSGRLGKISLSGKGGIIGSYISSETIGPVDIAGGFGFISSTIAASGASIIDGITTDGLGIRGSAVTGGRSVGTISARGVSGRILSLNSYTGSVGYSQKFAFDPYSGKAVSANTDLYLAVGIPNGLQKLSGLTNEGIIENSRFTGGRTLGSMLAYQIRAVDSRNRAPTSGAFRMRADFADSIGTVRVAESIQGLGMVTGRLQSLRTNGEANKFALQASGRVTEVVIGGSLRGTSSVRASGPSGVLDRLVTGRSLFGKVDASVRIGSVFVGADLGSSNVRSQGSFGTLEVIGDILAGANVRASGRMDSLIVGRNIQDGATVRATSYGKQKVDGTIFGDVIVG